MLLTTYVSFASDDEYRTFRFGDLSIDLDITQDKSWCEDKKHEPYVKKELRCFVFSLQGNQYFGGFVVKGDNIEQGLFLNSETPEFLLEASYFEFYEIENKSYILAHQEGVHVTYSNLYQLEVGDNVSLKKMHSYDRPYDRVYKVPNGLIYIGYNSERFIPWALYFDGEKVQELEFLGEPDELVPWNPDDDKQEKTEGKIRY